MVIVEHKRPVTVDQDMHEVSLTVSVVARGMLFPDRRGAVTALTVVVRNFHMKYCSLSGSRLQDSRPGSAQSRSSDGNSSNRSRRSSSYCSSSHSNTNSGCGMSSTGCYFRKDEEP